MLRKYFIGIFLVTVSYFCNAQNAEKNWLFGTRCAIEFTTSGPTTSGYATGSSMMNMSEGGTCISDDNGNLLFYYSNNTIYTPSHSLMTNGTLGVSSTHLAAQGTVIVNLPNNPDIYYVFYTSDWNVVSSQGLYYAIVDMSLSSGAGAVTVKDQPLNPNIRERLIAVNKPCDDDVWIVGHEKGSNKYIAYLFTENGLDTTPVVSSVGSIHNSSNIYGCMRISKDASKLAIANGGSSATLELSDFDYNTGVVSNTYALATSSTMAHTYGLEFSPNGQILYAAQFNATQVYQYDLSSGDSATIVASRIAIDGSSLVNKGTLLCGPDEKIYISLNGSSALSVIQYPNIVGSGCSYSHGSIATGNTVQLGLPNFPIKIISGCYFDICEDCIPSYSPFAGKTYVLSAWVKEEDPSLDKTTYDEAQITLAFAGTGGATAGPFKAKGDIIDGWQRIEETFTIPGSAVDIQIKLSCPGVDGYFDDIRVFPTDGSMKSYVYDPISLKLVAELDENNYATFYEYDEEGMLVRVKKETERGVMTIQENRNSAPKQ